MKIFILLRKEIGDPDVEFLIREKDIVNDNLANGLREDMLPFLKDVFPSKRYLAIKGVLDRAYPFIYKLLREHKETFDPSKLISWFSLSFFICSLFHYFLHLVS